MSLFHSALRFRTTFGRLKLTPSPLLFPNFVHPKPIISFPTLLPRTTSITFTNIKLTRGLPPINVIHARQYSTSNSDNLPSDPLNSPKLPLGMWKSLIKPILFSSLALLFLAHVFTYETGKRQTIGQQAIEQQEKNKRRELEMDHTPLGKIKLWWHKLSTPAKMQLLIIGLNTTVFLMWRSIPLLPFMTKYFMSSTLNPRFSTFVLSSFSHFQPWHLFFNMVAFYSFSSIAVPLGMERFLCLYFASGIGASLFSHLTRLVGRSVVSSLGASGCVIGLAGFLTCVSPDTSFMFIFLPFVSFKAITLISGLTVFETLGLLGIWKRIGLNLNFDHAAHLAGLAIGYFWVNIIYFYSKGFSILFPSNK